MDVGGTGPSGMVLILYGNDIAVKAEDPNELAELDKGVGFYPQSEDNRVSSCGHPFCVLSLGVRGDDHSVPT